MTRLFSLIFLLLSIFFVTGCSSDNDQLIPDPEPEEVSYEDQLKEVLEIADGCFENANTAQEMYDSFMAAEMPDIIEDTYVADEDMGLKTTDGRVFIYDFRPQEEEPEVDPELLNSLSKPSRTDEISVNSDRKVVMFWGFDLGGFEDLSGEGGLNTSSNKSKFMSIVEQYHDSEFKFKEGFCDLTIDNLKAYLTSAGTIIIGSHGYAAFGSHWTKTKDTISFIKLDDESDSGTLSHEEIKSGNGTIGYVRYKFGYLSYPWWYLIVSDKFFEECPGEFPDNSIMIAATCNSLSDNDNRWNVLSKKNLGAYYGYDDTHEIYAEIDDFKAIADKMLAGYTIGETISMTDRLHEKYFRGDKNVTYSEDGPTIHAITLKVDCPAGKYYLDASPSPAKMTYTDGEEIKTTTQKFEFVTYGEHEIKIYYKKYKEPQEFDGTTYTDPTYYIDRMEGSLAPYVTEMNLHLCKMTVRYDNLVFRGFMGFRNLKTLTAENLESIGVGTFGSGSKLEELRLPKCKIIKQNAFNQSTSLVTVDLPECIEIKGAFPNCSSLKEVALPKCTEINKGFPNCTSLTEVVLPSVITIGESAFEGCKSLHSISAPECTTLGDNAFSNCENLQTVSLPLLNASGNGAFRSCTTLRSIDFPLIKTIGDVSFSGCKNLSNVDIPEAIEIADGAFKGCESIKSISLPKVEILRSHAFESTGLTKVTLPAVKIVEGFAFNGCRQLTTLHLSECLSKIDFSSLVYGSRIRTVYIPAPSLDMPGPYTVEYLVFASEKCELDGWGGWYPTEITRYYVKPGVYNKIENTSYTSVHMHICEDMMYRSFTHELQGVFLY